MDRRKSSIPSSPSYSYINPPSIPTTPSLLSRPPSQTHLRLSRPRTTINKTTIPSSKSTPALSSKPLKPVKRSHDTRRGGDQDDDDWLTRTASTLTLTRMEEKGQSWLVNRWSSTNLIAGGEEEDGAGDGNYHSPSHCRQLEKRGGHGYSDTRLTSQHRTKSRRESLGKSRGGEAPTNDIPGPDFVNPDLEEAELEGVDYDGAGMGIDIDEFEMRKIVLGRIGGWVDWAVGWMDVRGEEGFGEGEDEEEGRDGEQGFGDEVGDKGRGEGGEGGDRGRGELDAGELERRLKGNIGGRNEGGEMGLEERGMGGVDKPAEGEQAGVWDDAKWLLGVARRVVL